MRELEKQYYFVDINTVTKEVVDWGPTPTATLTGETDDPDIHRVFLTKGQFNKLKSSLERAK